MSVATEIERIINAKYSIKTAIENKGVEVGEGRIDIYASKIEEINGSGNENLSVELTEQNKILNTQEVTIENIIKALEGKSAGGITPSIEGNILILSGANVEGGVLSI